MFDHLPSDGHTLFSSPPPRRFFLIPDDAELPEGGLELSSLTGRSLTVDPDVASVWAIEEEEAQAWAGRQVKDIGGKLRDILGGKRPPLDAPEEAKREEQRRRIAEKLGVTAQQLGSDPAAVRDGVLKVLGSLRGDLAALASESQVDRETVQARVDKLGQLARDKGLPELADAAEKLPDALRSLMHDPELVGRLREASSKLRQASAEMRAQREGESAD